MQAIYFPANERGYANYGWLDTHHTFSFGNFFDSSKMGFGVLRVLNDDEVSAGEGFSEHPHSNMEIISIPLEGDLEHRDSMGNTAIIKQGDVQVMSAGTGITHSEYNHNPDKPVKFLQIWIKPSKLNVEPRYGQMTLDKEKIKNNWGLIVSPNASDLPTWINQNAWFSMAEMDTGVELTYKIKRPGNGIFVFVIEGAVDAESGPLGRRDGLGITHTEQINIRASEKSLVLIMDIPT
ncbi:MAG: pirin family protein [Flavobacteriales bacterium]|nr:pirin family protein [Flavobacteriales bacterium]